MQLGLRGIVLSQISKNIMILYKSKFLELNYYAVAKFQLLMNLKVSKVTKI